MKKIIILIFSFFCIQNYVNAQKIDSISNSSFKMYSVKISTKSYSNNTEITQKAVMINYGNQNVYFVNKKTKIFLSDSNCLNNNLTSRIDTILFIHNYISKYFNDTSKLAMFKIKNLKYKNNIPIATYYHGELSIFSKHYTFDITKEANDIVYLNIDVKSTQFYVRYSSVSLKYVKCKEKHKRSFWELFFRVIFG